MITSYPLIITPTEICYNRYLPHSSPLLRVLTDVFYTLPGALCDGDSANARGAPARKYPPLRPQDSHP